MVRLKFSIILKYEIVNQACDFIFNIQAAQTNRQSLISENLQISQPVNLLHFTDQANGNRYVRLRADVGYLEVRYDAVVDIRHHISSPESVMEVPIAELPFDVLKYIYPSRYCQSDRLQQLVNAEFGGMKPGFWRVRAIQEWVQKNTRFQSGSSMSSTSAVDTLVDKVGVCRDFAHLMIALCRALNIPARFAAGIDYGSDPMYGPSDFHAYVEVYLSGGWYLFDPTGMVIPTGLIRLGTGRDAADVSFATIFGSVNSFQPCINIEGVEDIEHNIYLPQACVAALSTDV
jgi:transglutaminase-like putative cysteine protease